MKNAKILSIVLAIAMLLGLIAGCGNSAAPVQTAPAATEPAPVVTEAPAAETEVPAVITVTDMKGREITLDKPAERVIALAPSDCEILYAIGAGDALVGRGTYCDYPADVFAVQEVASGAETNIEQILALQPDLLLMNDMAQTVEQIQQLEAAGVPVVVTEATDVSGVYTAIEMIGTLMGKEDGAAEVIRTMRDAFDAVQKQTAGDGTQTVYFEVSPLQWGLWAAGNGSFMQELAELCGFGKSKTVSLLKKLCAEGCDVAMVEMRGAVGPGMFSVIVSDLMSRIKPYEPEIHLNSRLTEILPDGVIVTDVNTGEKSRIEGGTVVLSLGVAPRAELASEFCGAFDNVLCIGDNVRSGRIPHAIKDAYIKSLHFLKD